MEFHLHTEIYRARPDVNAVAHTHPLWSTLFSMVGEPVQPVTMQAAVMGPMQRLPEDRVDQPEGAGRGARRGARAAIA